MNSIEVIPFNKLFVKNMDGYSPTRKLRNGSITYIPTQTKSKGHFIMMYKTGLVEDYTTADFIVGKNDLGEDTIVGFVNNTITKYYTSTI